MCCAFLDIIPSKELEEGKFSEKHEDYPIEKKLAIQLIAELSPEILPVFPEKVVTINACREIASHWQEVKAASEAVPTRRRAEVVTFLPADRAKQMFSQIWNSHFAKLVNSRSGAMGFVGAGLQAMESMFVSGKAKGIEFFNIMLQLEEKKSRANEKAGQNTIARLGGVHFLESATIPESSEGVEMSPEHIFQISLAQQFVEYLFIQKDFAGLTPFPTNLPDKDYINRTRNQSRSILEHIKVHGWRGIANPMLVNYLDKNIIIPDDLNSISRIATHDLNLSKDPKGKDVIVDPKISLGIDGEVSFRNFDAEIISPNGDGYTLLPFSKLMQFNEVELSEYFNTKNSTIKWTNFPKLIDIDELPRTHFIISKCDSAEDPSNDTILSHRANHGFSRRHIHLLGRKIQQFTGHFRQDGQEAANDLINTARVLKTSVSSDSPETITVYPNYASTNETNTHTKEQQQIESALGISDVTFNYNFDQQQMSQSVRTINKHLVNPSRSKIEEILQSPRGKTAIANLLKDKTIISEEQVINELQDIINPRINRQMLLNLVLKQGSTISTASCVFPGQSYGRVSLAITPNCSEIVLSAFEEQQSPLEESILLELKRALELFTVEQSLAYLGLPPLGYLGVYTHRSKGPAQSSAEFLTKDANNLAAIDLIVSDIKYAEGVSVFHSAQSQYDDNTFGAIGIVNGRMSARLNLTKKSLLNRLLNIREVDEWGILPTKEVGDKSLFPTFLKREIDSKEIATMGSFIANLYRYPNRSLATLYKGILEDHPKFLKPDGVEVADIAPILARALLSATYKTVEKRRDQWENLAENLAISLEHDYATRES